jgi:hypothetical protein
MQHRRRAKRRQQQFSTLVCELQRRPADLLHRARGNAGAERRRHHLRAQANAERRLAGSQPRRHRGDLVGDERIDVGFINADRTAEDDQQIGRQQRLGIDRLHAGVVVAHTKAAR